MGVEGGGELRRSDVGGGGGGEFCYNAGAWKCSKEQTTGDRTSSAFTLFLLCVPAISSSRSPHDQLPQTVKREREKNETE